MWSKRPARVVEPLLVWRASRLRSFFVVAEDVQLRLPADRPELLVRLVQVSPMM